MELNIKEVAKELAPMLETSIKESVSAEMKDANEVMEALKKDIAEMKELSKKTANIDGKADLQKVGKFFKAMIKSDFAEMKVLSEGVDADGGYLVHPEFHKQVIRVAELSGFARKYCSVLPMGSSSKNVTTLSTGAIAYVVGEGSAITASTPAFGQKILNARKFAALVKGYQELIDDNSTDEEVATLVAKLCAEALAQLEDAQVQTGTGVGLNMLGVLADPLVNVVTMGAGDISFANITYTYLLAVKNAVKNKYKKASKGKVVWAMSQDIFNHIEGLLDTTGRPILKESANTPDNYNLLGYPVDINEVNPDDTADAVSTKFLSFGAYAFFALGDRKQISTEVGYSAGGFEKDEKSFKVTERVAGINLIPDAFAVLKTAAV